MSENTTLRAVRLGLRLSQAELALAIRQAGERTGERNTCSKRLIQRWEAGTVAAPRPNYIRALEHVTGQPAGNLGFADKKYGVDRAEAMAGGTWTETDPDAQGPLTGIWRSRYEYPSSSRGGTYSSEHYVLLIQRGARVQVQSVPASASRVIMDLTVNGSVVTGTWSEETEAGGYYSGAVYHGCLQLLLDPTGHRLTGRWLGYGRDFDINDGPWTLTLVSSDTSREQMDRYNTVPE